MQAGRKSRGRSVNFVSFSQVKKRLHGRRIVIVGSAPSCVEHEPGFIDAHDVVVRVNNFKTGPGQGYRTDVHYSFYGTSIRKTAQELAGVWLCMNKCPNSKPIESEWHERNGKQVGIDFRYIYQHRAGWWFCDTFSPTNEHFLKSFNLLDRHIPTTGFAAILDVLACRPRSLLLTGFDFFQSGLHNVNERWQPGDAGDPICHRPDLEAAWIREHADSFVLDSRLRQIFDMELA